MLLARAPVSSTCSTFCIPLFGMLGQVSNPSSSPSLSPHRSRLPHPPLHGTLTATPRPLTLHCGRFEVFQASILYLLRLSSLTLTRPAQAHKSLFLVKLPARRTHQSQFRARTGSLARRHPFIQNSSTSRARYWPECPASMSTYTSDSHLIDLNASRDRTGTAMQHTGGQTLSDEMMDSTLGQLSVPLDSKSDVRSHNDGLSPRFSPLSSRRPRYLESIATGCR
ncbi:hypothetical protein IWX50DRAFT_650488 [Phyllosticta citricarpa]